MYTQSNSYGAEAWQVIVLNEENSEGQREVRFKNDYAGLYMAYDGTNLRGSHDEMADETIFYYEEA